MSDRIPLLLDVDTGIDDSLALLLACATPEVELVAASCVGGNVPARQVADNTRAVLELSGAGRVPVALGRESPLVRPLETAEETHGPLGLGYADPAPATRPLVRQSAAEVIVEAARARPGEITLVTLGPLTNLALALDREPELPRLLRGWTLMGGAYGVPGNTTPTAEWNVHVDPDAAREALAGWAAVLERHPTLPRPLAMGLDVTERTPFLPEHLRQLALLGGALPVDAERLAHEPVEAIGSVAANPVLLFIVEALRFYFEFHARYDGFYGAFVHDPIALAATLDRRLVTTRPVFVDVETGPGPARAMTVADWRGLTKRQPNVDVAVTGDAAAFLRLIVERLGGLASDRSAVAR